CASLRAVVLLSFSLSYQSLTTESFPLSLHDALPIFEGDGVGALRHHQDLGERQAAKQGGQGQGGHESSDRLQHAGSFSLDDGSGTKHQETDATGAATNCIMMSSCADGKVRAAAASTGRRVRSGGRTSRSTRVNRRDFLGASCLIQVA